MITENIVKQKPTSSNKKLNLILIGIILGLVGLIEFGLRTYDVISGKIIDQNSLESPNASRTNKHPILEYTARRNFDGEIKEIEPGKYFKIKTNSAGFRTHEFYPKLPGEYRIVILGDSFTFGFNANQDETYPAVLEALLQKNISPNISVFSLGIDGYSTLKYNLLLKIYQDLIKPDLVIVAVDESDFNEDLNFSQHYIFDQNQLPIGPKYFDRSPMALNMPYTVLNTQAELFTDETQIFWLRLKLGFSTLKYLSAGYEKIFDLMAISKAQSINTELQSNRENTTTYKDLSTKYGSKISENLPEKFQNDFISLDTTTALKTYEPTIRFLKDIKSQTDQKKKTKLIFTIYPYPWMVSIQESMPYQKFTFGTIYDMRLNRVYPEIMTEISNQLNVKLLNSFPIFENLPSGYYGAYDPHFNAKGYALYARFIYDSIEADVSHQIQNLQTSN